MPQALNNLSMVELLSGGIIPVRGGRRSSAQNGSTNSDQLASAQQKLIERVLGLIGNRFRMNTRSNLDVFVHLVGRDLDLFDIEIAFQFFEQAPTVVVRVAPAPASGCSVPLPAASSTRQ